MQKISVVINTYNAARTLERALAAVQSFDEIVVCDMESFDNTVEIAKRYGAKVLTFPKANHKSAEPARTFAIQAATNPWVLVVDADELVSGELHDYLYAHIAQQDPAEGLYIPRMNHILGTFLHSTYPDYQLRFFRREGTTWPPYVHTSAQVKGRLEYIPAKRKELALKHMSRTFAEDFNAANNYTDNEVERRGIKHVSLAALVLKPWVRFFKVFFLKGAWRLGRTGYIQAKMQANYKFMLLAKAYEKEMSAKQHNSI